MTSAFSWPNSISLCPASFRIPRPNVPVTFMAMVAMFLGWPGSPGTELLPCACCQAASAKHTHLASFWLLAHVTKSATIMVPTVGLQSPSPQYLQHYWG